MSLFSAQFCMPYCQSKCNAEPNMAPLLQCCTHQLMACKPMMHSSQCGQLLQDSSACCWQLLSYDSDRVASCQLLLPTLHSCPAGSPVLSPVMDLTEDTACETCHSADDADNMLLRDRCNRGYHTHCLRPKVETIPEGEWFCQRCEAKSTEAKRKASASTGKGAVLVTDSDSDAEDFQAQPRKPAGRLTARQGAIVGRRQCFLLPQL